METVRNLILKELTESQEYDNYGSLEVCAVKFIGYKNKKNIGKIILSLDTVDIELYKVKERIENVLIENGINYNRVYIEL